MQVRKNKKKIKNSLGASNGGYKHMPSKKK